MKTVSRTIFTVIVFAIAMGFLESSVVIYLREIYYKEGFHFPLKPMSLTLARIELFREAATIIMLVGAGYLAGNTKLERFAYFNIAFAVWDIFYYIFLYLFLSWPDSLATWDILFLIPVPWVGPVWAPCLLSLLMLTGSVFVIVQCARHKAFRISRMYWFSLISGAVICIFSFMWDFIIYHLNALSSGRTNLEEISGYIPASFNLAFFFTGFFFMMTPVFKTMFDTLKINSTINR